MKPHKELLIELCPGPEALEAFLQRTPTIFNLTEIERLIDVHPGRLRHIRTGIRGVKSEVYEKFQTIVLPNLYELVFILQQWPPNPARYQRPVLRVPSSVKKKAARQYRRRR